MKSGHRILYHCGECSRNDSSHRLLLVRHSSACDSWRAYLYSEETAEQIFQSSEGSIDSVQRRAQMFALNHGVSPILHDKQEFAA